MPSVSSLELPPPRASSLVLPSVSASAVLVPLIAVSCLDLPVPQVSSVALPAVTVSVDATSLPPQLYSVLIVMHDDVAREYYECYDPRWGPINPVYGNQWRKRGDPTQTIPVDSSGVSSFAYPPTPFLNSLARNGMICERYHTAASCSPTRASILTGRDSIRHTLGQAISTRNLATPDGVPHKYAGRTIYELMEAQGSLYDRIHIGKWHVSENKNASIDGQPLGQANSDTAARRPVEVGRASYYHGSPAMFGVTPGYPLTPPAPNHHNWLEVEHDTRSGSVMYTAAQSTAHSLIVESDAAAAAMGLSTPFVCMAWLHMPHAPTSWDEFGGRDLSDLGYHTYGQDGLAKAQPSSAEYPLGEDSDIDDLALRIKAMVESIDIALARMVSAARADSSLPVMVVFVSDNGAGERISNTASPTSVPNTSPYALGHGKRSPWQGGIGGMCVINGAAVASPGDGVTARYWDGLCGAEDLFSLVAKWTGTDIPPDEPVYGTRALVDGVANAAAPGRDHYRRDSFVNGYAADPYSDDQGDEVRFVAAQNAAGWKLLWLKAASAPNPPPGGELTWQWSLYDLTADPLESLDLFWAVWAGSPQATYDVLTAPQRTQFNDLYVQLVAEDRIPPGQEIVLS